MDVAKKVGRSISICMAITLSLFLSLTGNLVGMVQSGRFDPIGFIVGFAVSTAISMVIGFVVPMGRIHQWVVEKNGPGLIARYIESLISDFIYTPLMTTIMVTMAFFMAKSHGQNPPFLGMYLPSLGISMVVGFLLIFFFQPFYMRMLMNKYGILPGDMPPGVPGGPDRPHGGPEGPEWRPNRPEGPEWQPDKPDDSGWRADRPDDSGWRADNPDDSVWHSERPQD